MGQKARFSNYHAEKLPSADSAELYYVNKISHVFGVIDARLAEQGTEYLVGDKVTFADLAWVSVCVKAFERERWLICSVDGGWLLAIVEEKEE